MIFFIIDLKGIRITGNESVFSLGSLATLNCTTDLAVERIEWLDQKGLTVTNGTEPFLELTTEAIKAQFTCLVDNMFGSQNITVSLKVLSDPLSSPLLSSAVSATIVIFFIILLLTSVVLILLFLRYVSPFTQVNITISLKFFYLLSASGRSVMVN